jgi:hypothetical protein
VGSSPYIVTAALPDDIFAWADGLRRAHFPPERNHLHAHVTLFHAFAPSLFEELKPYLARVAGEFAPPPGHIAGLINLGKGTAIALHSPQLLEIRAHITEHFHGSLTAQDLHEPRLHITIQNKVSKEEAKALQAELAGAIKPREFAFPALELHIYRGGPWEFVKRCAFRGQ